MTKYYKELNEMIKALSVYIKNDFKDEDKDDVESVISQNAGILHSNTICLLLDLFDLIDSANKEYEHLREHIHLLNLCDENNHIRSKEDMQTIDDMCEQFNKNQVASVIGLLDRYISHLEYLYIDPDDYEICSCCGTKIYEYDEDIYTCARCCLRLSAEANKEHSTFEPDCDLDESNYE